MANEFKHADVGGGLTEAEYDSVTGHQFASQATGDIMYASSSSQLSRLGVGATGAVLTVTGGVPVWDTTWTPTGALIPAADDTYDLGSASAAWQDLFLEGDISFTDGGNITFTPSTDDTVVMTASTNGAFSLVTTDTAAAAANIQITADGTVDIDSAGVLTLDSGAAINIEPASGSAILLDGTISIDAGVVTGATSITSENVTITSDIAVDGISNLDNTDIDGTLVVDGTNISLDSTTTLNIDNSNTSNGITIGTATASVPITIGHGTGSTVTIGNDLTVAGDLLVSGDTITVNTSTLAVEDPLIALATGNGADSVDVGFYAQYTATGVKYSGLFRDASDSDKWKLFATTGDSHAVPTTTVNTTSGFTLGTLVASAFEGDITGDVTGNADTVTTNANLTGHVTSSGNAAVLGSFTSAQLLGALTNETGSGVAVFNDSPTLITPALGTPASGVMTNMTGAVTASIGDNQVTLAKIEDIARGSIVIGNASAATAELTKGADGYVLTSDGTDIAWAASTVGDITAVTAGVGLSGGGGSGDVTLTLDLSELSTVTPADGDFFSTLDSDGANEQKTTTTALATLFAGDGLQASSSVLSLDLVSNGGLEIASGEVQVAAGISQYDVAQFAASVADNDFLKIATTSVEGRSAAEVLSDIAALPLAGGTMTGNITLGDNRIIIDSTVADGTVSGITTTGVAGSNMVVGDVIVLSADNAWDPANADSAAADALGTGMLGIALTAYAGSGSTAINILLQGFIMVSGVYGFTSAGLPLYLDDTAGDMLQTAPSASGDFVRIVGYAHDDDDTIYFNPDNTWVEIA